MRMIVSKFYDNIEVKFSAEEEFSSDDTCYMPQLGTNELWKVYIALWRHCHKVESFANVKVCIFLRSIPIT